MNFFDTVKSNLLWKKTLTLLSGLILISGSTLDAASLPKPVGQPIIISPNPATNPDPILQNFQLVMDNFYQLPFYPGGSPDYLSQIYYFSNYYVGNGLIFNPCNDKLMHFTIGQNFILDLTGTYGVQIASNTFATSINKGFSWSYGPQIVPIIPLGGTISQQVNASLGPGLFTSYAKNGRLDASGWGGFDQVANPPNKVPQTTLLFTSSNNNGESFSTPRIVLSTNLDNAFTGGPFFTGVGPREFYLTPDTTNPNLLHASTMYVIWPASIFGNTFYFSSQDAGKTFSPPRQVYSMVDDPVWQAKHFDPDFTSDPNYFIYGGMSISSSHPFIVDHNVLLLPINRWYPKVGATTYTTTLQDTNFDQAVVRSLDNGKTWLKVAGATDQYLATVFPVFDPGFVDPSVAVTVRGVPVFGFLAAGDFQESNPVVSPSTGRLYLTYSASNPATASDPANPSVLSSNILLSVSSDQGATFSHAVQINRTPTNISFGAQMAFGQGVAITQDGYYVVSYYDFRNWTGFPGEDLETTPLPTDAWLDVYKETEDPRGGSTGVGLDFVGEIRLTPQSFNARNILLGTSIPYVSPFITGTPEGMPIKVNENNELFVVYSVQSNSTSPSNITIGFKGATIDTNPYFTLILKRFKFANVSNQ